MLASTTDLQSVLEQLAWLAAPRLGRARILGTITLASHQPGRYTQAELTLAENLARRTASAIEHTPTALTIPTHPRHPTNCTTGILAIPHRRRRLPRTGVDARGVVSSPGCGLALDLISDPAGLWRTTRVTRGWPGRYPVADRAVPPPSFLGTSDLTVRRHARDDDAPWGLAKSGSRALRRRPPLAAARPRLKLGRCPQR